MNALTLLLFAVSLSEESATERDLRMRIDHLESQNRELAAWLRIAREQAYGNTSLPTQIRQTAESVKKAAKKHDEEIAAVRLSQAESSAAVLSLEALAETQLEYERQLVAMQKDLRAVVTLHRRALGAMVVQTLLLLLFTGTIVYAPKRMQARLDSYIRRSDSSHEELRPQG
mgnify:CR=1 FL=1